MGNDKARRIRELNDRLRCHGRGGRIVITCGISALGQEALASILEAVQNFDAFSGDNDPYRERDFGLLEVDEHSIMWKIDYYDTSLEFASPDPADPSQTLRVMTVMLAEEY